MGVPLSRGGNGRHGYPPHRVIHQEAAGDHSRKGGLPTHILAAHGSGADAGDEPVGTIMGPRRGK